MGTPLKQVQRVHRGADLPLAAMVARLTGQSAADSKLIIRMGGAYLGKYRCKQADRAVKNGERVSVYYRLPLVYDPVPFDPIWVLLDRRDFLLANKPPGLPTQGRRDADYMAFFEVLKKGLDGYLGLHHRLDQDTSGLMLFTRHRDRNKDVADLFSGRDVVKTYVAVAQGDWPHGEDSLTVDAPIAPWRTKTGTRQRVHGDGKPASTVFRRLWSSGGLHLIEAIPHTGRTHQIRVHLAHVGLPLLGDSLYGAPTEDTPAPPPKPAFLLHCAGLAWPKQGRIPGGNYGVAPPEIWWSRLPAEAREAFRQWWRDRGAPDSNHPATGLVSLPARETTPIGSRGESC
ncbi:RNA pseudouridine synthase [Sulfidibacter corallicola]|uniref:RNA pseudouridine synthase n=1 Tax=Sulfidibacter corallicola TaxID=2818388 RepID=A0A8A4TX84_SULCO|nr:RNA pseudouridine synthase [Sulfidibacter corallicola]QTD53582.1 RNA pseudouridine synthase [Sulfidibacter corallicola]